MAPRRRYYGRRRSGGLSYAATAAAVRKGMAGYARQRASKAATRRRFPLTKAGARAAYKAMQGPYGVRIVPSTSEGIQRYGKTWALAGPQQKANRRSDHHYGHGLYRGQGGFWGNLWKNRSKWFDAAAAGANALGYGHIANPIREGLKVAGIGEYSTNALVDEGMKHFEGIPRFGPVSDTGLLQVTHMEYVSDVYGPESTGFSIQEYDINPGIEKTFNWLAQIAANYEEYTIMQLMFTFKSSVSDFQTTNGVCGTVYGCVQYNNRSPSFTSTAEMMNTFGVGSCKSTDGLIIGVECDPTKNQGSPNKFIRTHALEATEDPNEFDLGRYTLALADFPQQLQDQKIGELYVSYTIQLRRPRRYTGDGKAISMDKYAFKPTKGLQLVGGVNDVLSTYNTKDLSEHLVCSENNLGTRLRDAGFPSLSSIAGNLGVCTFGQNMANAYLLGNLPIAQGVAIDFPATYSGTVEIILTLRSDAVDSGSTQGTTGYVLMGATGNITGINDILTHQTNGTIDAGALQEQVFTPSMSTCHQCTGGGWQAADYPELTVRLHVRIFSSSGGIDNTVYISPALLGANQQPIIGLQSWLMTIQEYNPSYTDSDGVPSWVNPQSKQDYIQQVP